MEETTGPTETTSAAPSSFAEAAATLEASSASTPAATTTTEAIAPAATVQAVDGMPTGVESASTPTDQKRGTRLPNGTFAPPEERWPEILDNQRTKAAKEAEDRVRQEYAWAQQIEQSERDGLMTWRAALRGDPQAIATIRANPQVLQHLRGLVAEEAVDAEPEADLQAPDGTLVYSAQQLARRETWREKRMEQAFQKQLQPFQQIAQTFRQREQEAAYYTSTDQVIKQMAAADPAFKAHAQDVAAVINGDAKLSRMAYGDGTSEPDPATALEIAWARVHRDKVLPTLSQTERSSVLADMNRKSAATTVNPGRTTVQLPKRPTDFYEAARMLQEQR